MNYNHLLANFQFDKESLLKYGFEEIKPNTLQYRVDLPNSLYISIKISPAKLDVEVYDAIFNDRYQPFVSGHGGAAIKSEVREIVEKILNSCGKKVDVKAQVIGFMREKFGTEPEFPWDTRSCTFKTARSNKWYAIIMNIPCRCLGLDGENVDVMNVKLPPEQAASLPDGRRYFPAYHMNKKHWVTAVLNAESDFSELTQLITVSHDLVEK